MIFASILSASLQAQGKQTLARQHQQNAWTDGAECMDCLCFGKLAAQLMNQP